MKASKDNWKTFWFESNSSFGPCENRSQWEELKGYYIEVHRSLDPADAKMATYGQTLEECTDLQKVNFGFRAEHRGDYTLADFARDNGMIL